MSPSRDLRLTYAVDTPASALLGVELWYSFNRGESWRLYGRDEDMTPPMAMRAPETGLCALYFVVISRSGPSGPPPSTATLPHLWVIIDEQPPVVQFTAPRIEQGDGAQPFVHLRWTMLEDHPAERPIDLAYRAGEDEPWRDVARDLPNSGAYDWPLPAGADSVLAFRLTARDRAGLRTEVVTDPVEPNDAGVATTDDEGEASPRRTRPPLSAEELKRARELLRMGRRHQLHGDHELAAARLRDALKIDPEMPEALVGLGASLYALGEFEQSAQAFELALKCTPGDRDALEGLAQTLVAMKKYAAAEARLLLIVKHRPQDVETWLHLGDIAIYRGNEIVARDYYLKAATLSPGAVSVVSRARARLDDLPALHQRSGRTETP